MGQEIEIQLSSQEIKTTVSLAKDWRQIRRLYREVVLQNTSSLSIQQKLLEDTILHLTTQIELLQFENDGLREAVINEKKKRKRGKALFEELRVENGSQATFFSPMKIKRAQELQEQREQEKQQAIALKQQEKLHRAIHKQEKQRELEQRRQLRLEQKAARALVQAQKRQEFKERKEARQAERQLQDETRAIARAPATPGRPILGDHRPIAVVEDEIHAGVVEQAIGRPSRARRLPAHLEAYELA